MPVKPLEDKRVAIAPMVKPITKLALQRLAALTGMSQGGLIDEGVAGTISMYEDRPLEEGESPVLNEPITEAMVEKATTRVPVPFANVVVDGSHH